MNMLEEIGLFWLKDDFRLNKNLALIEATKKHDHVVVFIDNRDTIGEIETIFA